MPETLLRVAESIAASIMPSIPLISTILLMLT